MSGDDVGVGLGWGSVGSDGNIGRVGSIGRVGKVGSNGRRVGAASTEWWLNLVGAQHLRCQEGPQQFVKWSGSPGCGQLKAVSTSSEKMFEVLVQHRCPPEKDIRKSRRSTELSEAWECACNEGILGQQWKLTW